MANYIKVNGLYLKDYRVRTSQEGRDYVNDLVFTDNVEEAVNVPNFLLIRVLAGTRKALQKRDEGSSYLFSIDSVNGAPQAQLKAVNPTAFTHKHPTGPTAVEVAMAAKPTPASADPAVEVVETTSAEETTKKSRTRAVCANPVKLDLDWLKAYMLKRGISSLQLARDLGFTGDRVYYGTKILKGLVNISREQAQAFIIKYPAAAGRLIKE